MQLPCVRTAIVGSISGEAQPGSRADLREMPRMPLTSTLGVMKVRTIRTEKDVHLLVDTVTRSAERAIEQVAKVSAGAKGLQVLWSMKFSPIGCDPLDADSPLNLIEQLNQTFTYLATAKALKLLFELHPERAPFTVNLGTSSGSDIESEQSLAAEVFAAVNTSNNRKLAKDLAKVGQTPAELKFVFFMCPGYEQGRQNKLERAGIQVWSVGDSL